MILTNSISLISSASRMILDIFRFISLTLFVGVLNGFCITPVIAMKDNPEAFGHVPADILEYAFSYFFGAFMSSTCIFVTYSIVKFNKPLVNPEVILPSLLSGILYSTGIVLLFLSTEKLSQAITGPLSSMMPGCVSSAWSIFYFNEIEPGRNLHLLYAGMAVTLTGAVLFGFSK